MCVCVCVREREREREREEEIGSWVFYYHHHHVIWFTVTALQYNVKNIKKDVVYLTRCLIVITNEILSKICLTPLFSCVKCGFC